MVVPVMKILKVLGIIAGAYLVAGGLLKLNTPLDMGMPPAMQLIIGAVILFISFKVLK